MEHTAIEPILNGNRYYLLFSIQRSEALTTYSLVKDAQSILLSDLLPDEVKIYHISSIPSQPGSIPLMALDGRLYTEEAMEICRICYRELVKIRPISKEPVISSWWTNRG